MVSNGSSSSPFEQLLRAKRPQPTGAMPNNQVVHHPRRPILHTEEQEEVRLLHPLKPCQKWLFPNRPMPKETIEGKSSSSTHSSTTVGGSTLVSTSLGNVYGRPSLSTKYTEPLARFKRTATPSSNRTESQVRSILSYRDMFAAEGVSLRKLGIDT